MVYLVFIFYFLFLYRFLVLPPLRIPLTLLMVRDTWFLFCFVSLLSTSSVENTVHTFNGAVYLGFFLFFFISLLSTSSVENTLVFHATPVRLSGLLQMYSSSRSLHPSGGTCPQPLPSCMCTGGVIRSFSSRLGQPLSGLTATPRR